MLQVRRGLLAAEQREPDGRGVPAQGEAGRLGGESPLVQQVQTRYVPAIHFCCVVVQIFITLAWLCLNGTIERSSEWREMHCKT